MSERVTYARLQWAGGVHRFKIDLSSQFTLYPIRDPYARLQRLVTGMWSPEDIYDTVIAALITGHFGSRGMSEANQIFDKFCRQRPIADALPLAQTIMSVAIFGIDAEIAEAGLSPQEVTVTPGDDDDGE